MSTNILERIYSADQIFVFDASFSDEKPEVKVSCCVPHASPGSYTIRPVQYVTAENYVRVLSQASYLLAHHILKSRLVPIDVSVEEFLMAVDGLSSLYYRNLSMTFHRRVSKGEKFEMELVLIDFREIRRLQDFIIFTFANRRTVISGEMSFVYLG